MRAKKRDPLRSGLFAPGPRSVGGGHTVKMAKASPKPPEYSILTAPHIHRATDISLRGPPTEKNSQRQLRARAERRARQRLRQAVDARSIGLLVQYGEARGARGGSTQADSFVAPEDEWPSTTVTTMQMDSQVETHLSAEAQYAQGVLDGRVVVDADAGAATVHVRPSDTPRTTGSALNWPRRSARRFCMPRAPPGEHALPGASRRTYLPCGRGPPRGGPPTAARGGHALHVVAHYTTPVAATASPHCSTPLTATREEFLPPRRRRPRRRSLRRRAQRGSRYSRASRPRAHFPIDRCRTPSQTRSTSSSGRGGERRRSRWHRPNRRPEVPPPAHSKSPG